MALQTTQSWRRRGIYPCALLKTVDTVSRPGGDEFIVLLTELTRAEDAADVARKVIAAVAGVHIVAGHPLRLSVSIGISVFPDDGQEADTLLKGADMALYLTKEQEPGCYRFFRPELNVRARERQAIEIGLRDGLERQEFRPAVPAEDQPEDRRRGRRRVADPLAASRAWAARTGRVRADRRGVWPDRADGSLGRPRGVSSGAGVAGRRPSPRPRLGEHFRPGVSEQGLRPAYRRYLDADGRAYVYRAATAPRTLAARAVRAIVDTLCRGSVEELVSGLVEEKCSARKSCASSKLRCAIIGNGGARDERLDADAHRARRSIAARGGHGRGGRAHGLAVSRPRPARSTCDLGLRAVADARVPAGNHVEPKPVPVRAAEPFARAIAFDALWPSLSASHQSISPSPSSRAARSLNWPSLAFGLYATSR